MANATDQAQKEAAEQLYKVVLGEMRAGADKKAISQKLVEIGIEEKEATRLVEAIHPQILKQAEDEKFQISALGPAILGGALAAAVGGGVWGWIVQLTNMEIGYIAWGIGLVAGWVVVKFAGGQKGLPLQIIAVLSATLGILLGKYVTFFFAMQRMITEQDGAETAAKLTVFSLKMFLFFMNHLVAMLSGFDALWVFLAVLTAWRIPAALGVKAPPSPFPVTIR